MVRPHHSVPMLLALIHFVCSSTSFGEGVQAAKRKALADLIRDLDSQDERQRDRAAKALQEPFDGFGVEPWDLHALQTVTDPGFAKQARALLPRIIQLLQHRDEDVVLTSFHLLMRVGTAADSAAPALTRVANNGKLSTSIRWQAARCLLLVTPETTPVLSRLLPKPGTDAMLYIPAEFARVPASNKLRVALKMTAQMVAIDLIKSGHTQVEVPALVKVASGKHAPDVRAFAVTLLAVLAGETRVKLPGLEVVLADDDADIRKTAAVALLLSRRTPKLTPTMIKQLKFSKAELKEIEDTVREGLAEEEKNHRQRVAGLMKHPETLPFLLRDLHFGRGPSRRAALRILKDAGPAASPAIPLLKNLLQHTDPQTRRLAREALSSISPT